MATKYYSGRVSRVLFADSSKAFYILKMVLDVEKSSGGLKGFFNAVKPVTVKGAIPGLKIQENIWFGFDADWAVHPKFGRQLAITQAPVLKGGWTPDTASHMLAGAGVAQSLVDLIRRHFGDAGFLDALKEVSALEAVAGVNKFTAGYIVARWNSTRALFQGISFLNEIKLPPSRIRSVWAHFGAQAEHVLAQNPWRLVEISGISFEMADEVARRMGLPMDSPHRIQGAVLDKATSQRSFGHLFTTPDVLVPLVRDVVHGATAKQIGQALVACHKNGTLVLDRKTRKGTTGIYEPWYHAMEEQGAEMLLTRKRTAAIGVGYGWGDLIKGLSQSGPLSAAKFGQVAEDLEGIKEIARAAVADWAAGTTFILSDEQKKGLVHALTQPVSVITGLPGTGKTTSLRALVRILQDAGINFLLLAPTGIAAKRIREVTGSEAFTIHRAFGAKGKGEDNRESVYAGIVGAQTARSGSDEDGSWGYDPSHPHGAQVVVVDESSMVDQHLLYRILNCTGPKCRVVFVGDAAQLPSVGPGNVLRDLIASKLFPTASLTEIFRQESTSQIVFAAHDIHAGIVPSTDKSQEFLLLPRGSEGATLATILKLARKMSDKDLQFQILSPRHRGTVGVTNLNERLRSLLNPSHPSLDEVRLANGTIREGDKVMVVKNNYKMGVYNGDVGKVMRIHRKKKEVSIQIRGIPPTVIYVPFGKVAQHLRLAYACTVHKCVAADTLVATAHGLVPISSLGKGLQEKEQCLVSHDVAGFSGWTQTDQVYCGGVVPTKKIQTRMGFTLEGSHEHPVLVCGSNGGFRWKKLPEVQLGDVMVLRKGVGNKAPLVSVDPDASPPGRDRLGVLPLVVDARLAWLLGVFIGDGNLTNEKDGRVEVGQKDPAFLKRLAQECRSVLGVNPTVRSGSMYFHGRRVREFLVWCGIGYVKAPKKEIPGVILQSPSHVQCAFLRGLYDTDGGVSHLVNFTSSSCTLAFQVQQLLLHLGIVSKRYLMRPADPDKNWAPAYRVEVSGGSDKKAFKQFVGFSIAKKQRLLDLLVKKARRSKSNVGLIPGSPILAKSLREALRQRGGRNYPEASSLGPLLSRAATGTNPLRVSHLSVLAEGIRGFESVSPLLHQMWEMDAFLDPVVGISSGESLVYDIHVVDEDHAFIGNGFVNHNSQGLEYSRVILPILDVFGPQLQRNLFYTAITRARKQVILVGSHRAMVRAVSNDRVDLRNTLFPERLGLACP